MEMICRFKRSIISWAVATGVATFIIWLGINFILSDKNRPCPERICYVNLDTRLKLLEVAMGCDGLNCDRFTKSEAIVLNDTLIKRIEELEKKSDDLRKR